LLAAGRGQEGRGNGVRPPSGLNGKDATEVKLGGKKRVLSTGVYGPQSVGTFMGIPVYVDENCGSTPYVISKESAKAFAAMNGTKPKRRWGGGAKGGGSHGSQK